MREEREFCLAYLPKTGYTLKRSKEIAVKVKPVQPTEIKDKKIARQVIEQIRKPITPEAKKRHKEEERLIRKFFE